MNINIKRIALSFSLPMAVVAGCFAQKITGKVIDTANHPVADVVITCPGCETVRTAADGTFTIEGVKSGSTVNFVREGYYPQSHLLKSATNNNRILKVHMIETDRARYNETSVLPTGKQENNVNVAGC